MSSIDFLGSRKDYCGQKHNRGYTDYGVMIECLVGMYLFKKIEYSMFNHGSNRYNREMLARSMTTVHNLDNVVAKCIFSLGLMHITVYVINEYITFFELLTRTSWYNHSACIFS